MASSLPTRETFEHRFRVLPSSDDPYLVHRKTLWDARGCKLSLDESELLDMPNDTLIDYLRILYLNEIDIYFLLNNASLIHSSKPIAYENPCNERKALFLARKLLMSQGASTQRVAKLQGKIDSFCQAANDVRISSEVEVSHPYVSEVAPKCVVGNRSSALGGGVGLYAKDSVSAGDDVIRVPEGDLRIINVYEAAADAEFGPVVEGLLAAGHHIDTCLLMYLVHIYKSGKLRALPPIDCFVHYLPSEFSGNLMEWPVEALDALGIPQIKHLVAQQMDLLWGIHRALPTGLCSSFDEELLWARSLCDSRAFSLEVPPPTWCPQWLIKYLPPDQSITCVVPGADLLNHHQRGQCGFPRFDKESCSFVITAEANVPAGSELFINYGGLQNWEQLMYYGFCEFAQNPYDSVTLDLAANGAADGLHLDRIGTEHIIRRGHPTVSPRLWEALTSMAGVEHPEELEEGAVDSLVNLLRQVTLAPLPESSAANDWWKDDYGAVVDQFRSSQMALVDEAERVLRNMVDQDRKTRAAHTSGRGSHRVAKSAKKRR